MGLANWWSTGSWNEPVEERAEEPYTAPLVDELVIPSREENRSVVTVDEALGLAAVYRAVFIIATAATQLSLDAYKAGEKLEQVPMIIRRPNQDIARETFVEQTVMSLATNGNAFWWVDRDSSGYNVTNLRVLNPTEVTIRQAASGAVTGYSYRGKDYTTKEIHHLPLISSPNSPRGIGPIQAAYPELRGAIDVRDYVSDYFPKSGIPSGILSSDQYLNDEQADANARHWAEQGAGRVRVLGNGLKYQGLYISPREAQFLEVQQFNTTQVARIFGIHPSLMFTSVEGGSMTYQNVAQAWTEFARFTLSKYTQVIETAFSQLLPGVTKAAFNYEALLRPDVVTRYEMHAKALAAGWLTQNEVRAIEGYPALPDGNTLAAPKEVTSDE